MTKRSGWLAALVTSLGGVVVLWVAFENLWLQLLITRSRLPVFLTSLALLSSGPLIGYALSLAGVELRHGKSRLLIAVSPFALMTLYFWYWLSGFPAFGFSPGGFLVSEMMFIGAPLIVGLGLGLVATQRKRAQDEPWQAAEMETTAS